MGRIAGRDACAIRPVGVWSPFSSAILKLGVCLILALLAPRAGAQGHRGGTISAQSRSGQFIVQGPAQPALLAPDLRKTIATNWIRLDAPLTAMSCERIKDAVLGRLDGRDQWRGKVQIRLWPLRHLDNPVQVTQTRFADRWSYRVEMPDTVPPEKLVHLVVRVVLTERVSRNSPGASFDLPVWLVEGLAQELLCDTALDLVVRAPDTQINSVNLRKTSQQNRRNPTLGAAHEFFSQGSTPLTFDELSWPAADQFSDAKAPVFRYSAQLLVHKLLLLRGGSESLGALLDHLGRVRNWQTAFLPAFQPHFARLLDVDKWWELERLSFLERGVSANWDVPDSLTRLQDVLNVPVQTQIGTNLSSQRAVTSLQLFLQQSEPEPQLALLPEKLRQLQYLPLRVAPQVAPLVQSYRKTLDTYLRELERNNSAPPTQRMNQFMFNRVLSAVVRDLNALDVSRGQLASGAPVLPTKKVITLRPRTPQAPGARFEPAAIIEPDPPKPDTER